MSGSGPSRRQLNGCFLFFAELSLLGTIDSLAAGSLRNSRQRRRALGLEKPLITARADFGATPGAGGAAIGGVIRR